MYASVEAADIPAGATEVEVRVALAKPCRSYRFRPAVVRLPVPRAHTTSPPPAERPNPGR
jgi:hypothetical protein